MSTPHLRSLACTLPLVASLVIIACPGCAGGFPKAGNMFGGPPEQSEPDMGDDKWSFVGKEARGNRALEDERDPFKPFIMSQQARDIERNLGFK